MELFKKWVFQGGGLTEGSPSTQHCQNATHLVSVSCTSTTSSMFLWQWAYWVSTISQECALDDVLHKSWCCNVNFVGQLLPNFVHPNHYLGSLCSVHKFPPLKSYCSIRSSDWKHISDSHKSMMWLYSCVVMMTGNRMQNDGSQIFSFWSLPKAALMFRTIHDIRMYWKREYLVMYSPSTRY